MALNEEDEGSARYSVYFIDQALSNNTIAKKQVITLLLMKSAASGITRVAANHANNPPPIATSVLNIIVLPLRHSRRWTIWINFDIATGHFINTSGQLAARRGGERDRDLPASILFPPEGGRAGRRKRRDLLTTWLVADGYKMDIDVQAVTFRLLRVMLIILRACI